MKHYSAILLLLVSVSAYGALNKWVDAEGNVHYSDVPPAPDVKTQTLTPPPSTGPAPKSYIEREAEFKKVQKAREEAAKKEEQEQKDAAEQQKNCDKSKSSLRTLQSSARISSLNDKGEKIIMDDATRQQQIEEARKLVEQWCKEK